MQAGLLAVAGAGAVVAVAASLADRARANRSDVDRVGVLPLPSIIFAGLLTAVLGLALALKL